MQINKHKSFKAALIITLLTSLLVACGGGGSSNSEKSNSKPDSNLPMETTDAKAVLSLKEKDTNNTFSINLDLKSLAAHLNIDNSPLLKVDNCESKNQPSFGDAVIRLSNDSTVKTLFLPVECDNQINTTLNNFSAGNWNVEVAVYNVSTDEVLISNVILALGDVVNSRKDIYFKKAGNQTNYTILKKLNDKNLAQEVNLLPTDYMTAVTGSFIYLGSTLNDYIGAGREYFYSSEEFSLFGYKNRMNVKVSGYDNSDWDGDFVLPDSYRSLSVGLFSNLYRYPFSSSKLGGLSWTGNGRGCNTSKSWMRVDQVTIENDALRSIDYRFGQHCEQDPYSALFGLVHWKSPRLNIGTKWQPTLTNIPNTSYIAIESDKGDYVGGGKNYLFTDENANIKIENTGNVLNVSVNGDTWWNGDFALPDTKVKIELGSFKNLIRYPFHNPRLGGLSWSGDGRGCNQLEGLFTVDHVKYDSSGLQSVDLRFEQHCEGNIPSLYGKIHWIRPN
ncbi:hypothetical protein [Acinetobacter sp. NBRC 100985]|uniref:hypothetical protein n=2 Tax=Acinetobacter TaxID=469 RepID=UPI000235F011|nr:hypothetical protein [Acinetobacter sp. NBRC 100985]GAB02481.1 hypothetical protein ACT4_032_00010 [Acinetobacter sp. NBRC 100985]